MSRSDSDTSSGENDARQRLRPFDEIHSPLQELSNLTNIVFVDVLSHLLLTIFFSLCVIERYRDQQDSIGPLFFLFAVFHFIRCCLFVFYANFYKKIYSLFKIFFHYTLASSFGYMVIYYGLFLYMESRISKNDLWLFVMPHLIGLFAMNFAKFEGENFRFIGKLRLNNLFLLEGLQNLFIALNLAFWNLDWEWSIILYEVFYLLWFFFVTILVVVAFMLLVYWAYRHKFDFFYFVTGFFMASIAFFFIFMGFAAYFIFDGFQHMLKNGYFDAANRGGPIDQTLYNTSVNVVFYGCLNLPLLIIGMILVKLFVFEYGPSDTEKLAKLQTILDVLFINISLQPGKAHNDLIAEDEEANPFVTRTRELKTCFKCHMNKSNIILKPCGHSGVCLDCFKRSFRAGFFCPICGGKVGRYYTFAFNEENQTFQPTGVHKFEDH